MFSDATLVAIADPHYPAHLREIYDPPIVLFAKGRLELLDTVMVGMIGSRRATPYGKAVAQKLSTELCAAGVTIVVEHLNRRECNIINSVAEAMEYIRAANHPARAEAPEVKACARFSRRDGLC